MEVDSRPQMAADLSPEKSFVIHSGEDRYPVTEKLKPLG